MLIWTTLGHFWTILGTFGRLFSHVSQPPITIIRGVSSTSENNFFPTFPKVCRKVKHGLKHLKCWLGPLWDTLRPFWAHLEGYRSRGLVCEPKGIFKQIQRAIRARASLREPEGAKESQRECPGVLGGSGGVRGMSRVFGESRDGQHWKKKFYQLSPKHLGQ